MYRQRVVMRKKGASSPKPDPTLCSLTEGVKMEPQIIIKEVWPPLSTLHKQRGRTLFLAFLKWTDTIQVWDY